MSGQGIKMKEILKPLNKIDLKKSESYISQLEKYQQSRSLAKNLRNSISTGYMTSKVKNQLADWCRPSNDPRRPAREIAGKISVTLFQKVLTEYD